jgi:hypothetical protein
VAPKVDIILLSHPDLLHLGALPYAMSKLGLKAPVYGTIPLFKMGQMFMYDAYQSRSNNQEFTLFDLDDVDSAFEHLEQLKYSQHLVLTGILLSFLFFSFLCFLLLLFPLLFHFLSFLHFSAISLYFIYGTHIKLAMKVKDKALRSHHTLLVI